LYQFYFLTNAGGGLTANRRDSARVMWTRIPDLHFDDATSIAARMHSTTPTTSTSSSILRIDLALRGYPAYEDLEKRLRATTITSTISTRWRAVSLTPESHISIVLNASPMRAARGGYDRAGIPKIVHQGRRHAGVIETTPTSLAIRPLATRKRVLAITFRDARRHRTRRPAAPHDRNALKAPAPADTGRYFRRLAAARSRTSAQGQKQI